MVEDDLGFYCVGEAALGAVKQTGISCEVEFYKEILPTTNFQA